MIPQVQSPSTSKSDSPAQPAVLLHQRNTASRLLAGEHSHTEEDSPPRKTSAATIENVIAPGVAKAATTATGTTIVPPLLDDSSFLSSILSCGPSPSSDGSNKTRKHMAPPYSSGYPWCHRSSADGNAQECGSLSPVCRSAHVIVMSHSPTAGSVISPLTNRGSPKIPSRASDRMPTECFSPPPLQGAEHTADVSISLKEAFFAAADLQAMRPVAAATLCTLLKLKETNRQSSPQAVLSPATTIGTAGVARAVAIEQANLDGATVSLRDSIQDCSGRGVANAHHPHPSPLSASSFLSGASDRGDEDAGGCKGDRLVALAHRRLDQRSLFWEPSLVVQTASILPSSTADAVISNGFGGGYSLFQPAVHPPSLRSPSLDTARVPPSHADLMTSALAEADDPYQHTRQQQQQQLSLLQQTDDLPTSSRSAVAEHSSLGSSLHPPEREATTAFDGACATEATEPRDGTAPLCSLAGCASTARVGPTAETETEVFPGVPFTTASEQLQTLRASRGTEARPAVEVQTPRRPFASSGEMTWHSAGHTARHTVFAPQKVEATVDEVLQPTHGGSGSVTDHPCHSLYNSPHTPRGLSVVSGASRSLSVSSSDFSTSYAVSFPCGRSGPVSASDRAAPALTVAAVQPEELDCCRTPTSPHTPLTNRTPGLVGLHDSYTAHHNPGTSHSRYRSQLLSHSVTPQKSGRRVFSRQTTPSQSFRSKVQSHSFESQQQHPYAARNISDLIKTQSQSNACRFLMNGESAGIAERDYLAPSRNPFSLYRTLEPYATDLLFSAPPLPENSTALAAALERAAVRPDAAVVLYSQLVPSPSHPPGASYCTQLEMSAASGPLAAFSQDCAAEHYLSHTNLARSASCRGGEHGRTSSVLFEHDRVTTPTGAAVDDHRSDCCITPPAGRHPFGQSPTKVSRTDPQPNATPFSFALPAAIHVGAPGSFTLLEMRPLTAQSLFCHCTQPPTSSVAASAAFSCSITPPASMTASCRRQPRWRESAEGGDASPSLRRPTQLPATVAPSSESRPSCSAVSANRQLKFEADAVDKEAAWGGCDEVHCPSSPVTGEDARSLKLVHARSPISLGVEGSGSAWSSHGSPNCLCHTVANIGISGSGQWSPAKALEAFLLPRTPLTQPAPEHEAAPTAHDGEATATALHFSSLGRTRSMNHTSRPQLVTPTLQRHPSPRREVPGLRISAESSWIRGPTTPLVAGASLPTRHADYADVSATAQVRCGWTESFSEPLEATDMSEEGVPGDRFQAHHAFQFLHSVVPTCGGGGVRTGMREDRRQAIPLCVEVNGVTWLAVHRLNGLPYALKEVPAAAFNLAELRCLTLSVVPPPTAATVSSAACGEPPEQHAAGLTGEDRLEAEDCIARYYSISTPPQNSINPEVHLLQIEYFPRGSLSEFARRCGEQHGTFSADEITSLKVGAGALSCRFWLEAVTQGLRGLRVLHRADLIHGCPLPLSLFLCGNTPSAMRFKWSCFGNARVDADIYPTESLPAWANEAVTRFYVLAASGCFTVAPDVVEVSVFCMGMLEMLVKYVSTQLSNVLPSRDSQHLSELEWIEVVVMHPRLHLYAGEESGEDMHALVRLMRFLWEVSNSFCTADQVLAQLSVRIDPAASVVEQLYECELARLTRQLEERRQRFHRPQRQEQLQALHNPNSASPLLADATFTRSLATKASVASASSRRQVEVSEPPSPPLHPAPDPVVTFHSVSHLGGAPPLQKSCDGSPQLFCPARHLPYHTLLSRPLTVPSRLLLPPSTAAAASVVTASPQVERTASDLSGQGCNGGMVGYRRSEIHRRILEAASHMLENAVNSGDGVRDAMTAILTPAVEYVYQRGWTSLYGGVPLTVAGGINADTTAGTREAAEALMRSLRPLTSFE